MNKRNDRSPRGDRPPRRSSSAKSGGAPPPKKKSFKDRPPRREEERPDRDADRGRGGPGGGDRRSTGRPSSGSSDRSRGPERSGDGPRGPRKPPGAGGRTSDGPRGPRKPFGEDSRSGPGTRGAGRSAGEGRSSERPRGPRKPSGEDSRSSERPRGPRRPADEGRQEGRSTRPPVGGARGPKTSSSRTSGKPAPKPWGRQSRDERTFKDGDPLSRRPFRRGERSNRFSLPNPDNEGLIRLNKYLANAGVGSRREADELITTGVVTVNGKVVTELGTKVKPDDIIHFGGQKLSIEKKRYVLLNKPKDTITTTDDPNERHTVMDLIAKACTERLYPVGRLDRQTTGVLLLTNDGDLAKKLTHPSYGAEKIYHVTLDKSVQAAHLQELVNGIQLDDGMARADEANYVAAADSRREVGIKIHMGRNRIVRRMFEALGYGVVKLDRVMFAGLTKKELQRGHWRHLSEKEITWLKKVPVQPGSAKEERGTGRLRRSYGSE